MFIFVFTVRVSTAYNKTPSIIENLKEPDLGPSGSYAMMVTGTKGHWTYQMPLTVRVSRLWRTTGTVKPTSVFTAKPKIYLLGNIVTTMEDGTQVSASAQFNLTLLSGIGISHRRMEPR